MQTMVGAPADLVTAEARDSPEVVTPGPDLAGRRRLDYVDALRGIACLGVILYHTFGQVDFPSRPVPIPLALLTTVSRLGWLGVHLFLVISGFCLYYPLVRKLPVNQIHVDLREFAARRAKRILPPYYAAILLFSALAVAKAHHKGLPISSAVGWQDLLAHLLMLHNLFPATVNTINVVFWTLALETQLYIIFPALVWLAGRRGLWTMLGVTALISVVWQTAFWWHDGSAAPFEILATRFYAMPGCCAEFAGGMVAAALVARPVPGQIRKSAWLLLFSLAALAAFYAVQPWGTGPLIPQLWAMVFACPLVMLSRVPEPLFEQNKLLQAVTWSGIISYSIYLIHQPLLMWSRPELLHLHQNTVIAGYGFARIIVVIALGYGFYLAVERPSIQFYKPRFRHSSALAPPPGPPPLA